MGVVMRGIVGDIKKEIKGGVIVKKCKVVVVEERRREVKERIRERKGKKVK
jgi:hypothetical protein